MLYKVLNDDGAPIYGTGTWHLPRGKRPGKWMPPIKGELEPCKNGYHLCRRGGLIQWLGPAIFEAESDGEIVETRDRVVARQARLIRRVDAWNERTARLFAADCAERVLPIFEAACPDDDRPRRAIEVARRYANGRATGEEMRVAATAAGAATLSAAGDAAWAAWAARDAAWAATWAAKYAAWVAAVAAKVAAGDTARDARDTERAWQADRLFEYLEGRA